MRRECKFQSSLVKIKSHKCSIRLIISTLKAVAAKRGPLMWDLWFQSGHLVPRCDPFRTPHQWWLLELPLYRLK
jgi:hypothetical protein